MTQKNLSNKKFFIPLSKLPYPNIDGKHRIRFRMTTVDRNEISEWSPIFVVDSPNQQTSASISYQYQAIGATATLSWLPNSRYKEYDIFISYDDAPLSYFTRTVNSGININIPTEATTLRVWVQLPSYPTPPSASNLFKLFDTGTITL
jgi:hypothetical protein